MAWGWVNFPANVHFGEKVCKAYLNQVSYLIRFYWDTEGARLIAWMQLITQDVLMHAPFTRSPPPGPSSRLLGWIRVGKANSCEFPRMAGQGASKCAMWQRQNERRALSEHRAWTQHRCWERQRGAEQEGKDEEKRKGNNTAVCLSLWNKVREWSIVRVDGIFNLMGMRTKL